MRSQTFIFLQNILPQHLLSEFAGKIADSRSPAVKNFLIKQFIKLYRVDLSEAKITNPTDYVSFNDFFIRELQSGTRPIDYHHDIITSPVDGTVATIGSINKQQLLQAKNSYFQLPQLLGEDNELAELFLDGHFATLYLAPHNYHRVHMPVDGKLVKTIYVPGKLFSVNRMTSDLVPNLYSRNERLIAIFETNAGYMALILVGAMIVGSIKTTWMEKPIRAKKIITEKFTPHISIKKGEEVGYFKLGSTVILLFQKNKIEWDKTVHTDSLVMLGQPIAKLTK